MRTTLDIDDDILSVANHLATDTKRSVGAVVSDLARKGLHQPTEPVEYRNGIALLPRRQGVVITPELVNELLHKDEY
jgi:hypothetical protein